MAQDKTQLPEGTDRIVTGASSAPGGEEPLIAGSGKPRTGAATGSRTADRKTGTQVDAGDTSTRERIVDKVRSGKDKVAGQAADRTREFVGQGLGRSSEALGNVSRMIGDTADGLDDKLGREYGDYARKAARAIDDAAQSLARKDPDELIDDTRAFVRKSPGVALAGAAIVGFALARLVKTGFDLDRDDRDSNRSRDTGGPRD